MKKTGITTLEIIVVLAIMATISVIAGIRFSSFDTLKLDAAAQKIAADLRYAQSLVMDRDAVTFDYLEWSRDENAILIYFDIPNNSYQIQQASCIGSPITDPHTQQAFLVDFDTIPEFQDVTITSTTLTPIGLPCSPYNDNVLMFNGGIGFPGIPLCSAMLPGQRCRNLDYFIAGFFDGLTPTIILQYRGNTRSITIEAQTGEISIE